MRRREQVWGSKSLGRATNDILKRSHLEHARWCRPAPFVNSNIRITLALGRGFLRAKGCREIHSRETGEGFLAREARISACAEVRKQFRPFEGNKYLQYTLCSQIEVLSLRVNKELPRNRAMISGSVLARGLLSLRLNSAAPPRGRVKGLTYSMSPGLECSRRWESTLYNMLGFPTCAAYWRLRYSWIRSNRFRNHIERSNG